MEYSEQQLTNLLELMDANQVEKALLVLNDGQADTFTASMATIKKQALSKANISRKRRLNKIQFLKLTAATILLLVMGVALYGPENTWAQVVKVLNFIPGIGKVVDNKPEITRYVLESPTTLKLAESSITVKAISIDCQHMMIEIEEIGDNLTLPAEEVILVLGEEEYILRQRSISHQRKLIKEDGELTVLDRLEDGAWIVLDWEGHFIRSGLDQLPAREGYVIVSFPKTEGKQVEIPIKMEIAPNFTDYADMGPTTSFKGLSITAIPFLEDNLLKISLLSPPLAGQQVRGYAYTFETIMTLADQSGNTYPMAAEKYEYTLPSNEIVFDLSGADTKQFILKLPCVVVRKEKEATIKLPLPQQGENVINKTVKLAGYKVVFHTVERLDERTIQLHVTLPQQELARARGKDHLVDFRLIRDAYSGSHGVGGDMHGDETGRYYKFKIAKDAKETSLTLTEPVLAIYGPWEIELDLDN